MSIEIKMQQEDMKHLSTKVDSQYINHMKFELYNPSDTYINY